MRTAGADQTGPADGWHTLPVRVYFEDTDAQGVVYFANYLRFMERGRTEWLRSHGIEQDSLLRAYNICFSLVNTCVRFVRPARFNEQLVILTRVTRLAGARILFEQAIHRNDLAGELLCSAECAAACLTADTFKPRRVPPELLLNLAA